jgi:phosphatidylserine/phosphatidylglycerophosphate/cardiolipin synthase-like enzyme
MKVFRLLQKLIPLFFFLLSIAYGQNIEVYFSPQGGCTQAVVDELATAKTTVLVQAYSFTSAPIAKALIDAHKRGVDIKVILDKSNATARYTAADFVLHAGIPCWIDPLHAIAHNKIMVIDGADVITGSFNFTKAAEYHNAENMLVIHDSNLAKHYSENWQIHFRHSYPYTGSQRILTPQR